MSTMRTFVESLEFQGKSYSFTGSITEHGEYTVEYKAWTALVIGKGGDPYAGKNHFLNKLVKSNPELEHNNKKLQDETEVSGLKEYLDTTYHNLGVSRGYLRGYLRGI